MPRKRTSHEFNEQLEKKITDIIVNDEYKVAKMNQSGLLSDFEAYLDLFDAERTEKEYDWMSDIFIPEFTSHMLTQSAIDVSQYFQTRDFVETYIQDPSEQALKAADATEELLNRTLNQRHLHHYQKFVRAKVLNHLNGHVDLHCWWEQELDEEGNPTIDRFNYEVLDPRNVFSDNVYTYSFQDKDWVTIRVERSLNQLKANEDRNNYFNLHLLEDTEPTQDTETKKETRDSEEPTTSIKNTISEKYDVLIRYGKFWIMPDGKPGIDREGKIKPKAEQTEMIITTVLTGGTQILIGFTSDTPYIDANGNPYRPIIRGLCYIHPVKDGGIGDGKYAREISVAINDTFNISNDRVKLATLPTLKGRKYAVDNGETIFFEPGHMMELNDPKDVEEFKIQDNIQGAMLQLGFLTNKMQQGDAIFPTTMGGVPEDSSTTATAIVGSEQRSNSRSNYKSMTFEYTALTELYWMIQQMTWEFAHPETGFKLMGDKIYDFNPTLDYFYKPLSQSIESDSSKAMKIRELNTMLGYVVQLQNPQLINSIIAQIFLLMGDEYVNFAQALFPPEQPMEQVGGQGNPQALPMGGGASNQYGIEQGNQEIMARGNL